MTISGDELNRSSINILITTHHESCSLVQLCWAAPHGVGRLFSGEVIEHDDEDGRRHSVPATIVSLKGTRLK